MTDHIFGCIQREVKTADRQLQFRKVFEAPNLELPGLPRRFPGNRPEGALSFTNAEWQRAGGSSAA